MRAAANKRGFKPVPLDATLSLDLKSTTAEKSSRNVVGLLPGSETPDEAIVYMAHWDHLGTHEGEPAATTSTTARSTTRPASPRSSKSPIVRKAKAPPKRSILFLAVTLEESGLLGSKYYVAHPVVPLDKTVAVFNLDALSPVGKARDITVVGQGSSQLEDLLKPLLDGQKRKAVGESNTAAGYYFRSDHFNFAKAGVPALYVDSGTDLLEGGQAAGDAAGKDYTDNRYHKPGDQYDAATWKLDGIIQDLGVVASLGNDTGERWPVAQLVRGQSVQGRPRRHAPRRPPARAPLLRNKHRTSDIGACMRAPLACIG